MPLAIHPKQEARRLELADVTGSRQQRSVHLQSLDRPQQLGDFAYQMLSAPDTRVSISSRTWGRTSHGTCGWLTRKSLRRIEKPTASRYRRTAARPSRT